MSDIQHIPATVSDDLLHARASIYAANAIAAEWIRQLHSDIQSGNDAEAARRNGNDDKDKTNQKGRPS